MLTKLIKTSAICAIWPLSYLEQPDSVDAQLPTVQKANVEAIKDETGWDRVERMFQTDEFGELSQELTTILHVGTMSALVGGIYGGTIFSREAYIDFIKNNQATAFNDHLHAKKKLQDKVTLSFARGGWKWGSRLAIFSTLFTGISTGISVYRGKTGLIEFVTAGMVSGALYKLNMGPRGWLVGGGLGTVLGLVGGGVTLGLLRLTGMSMDEVRYWQYYWRHKRVEHLQKTTTNFLNQEESELVKEHDKKLGIHGQHIDDLERNTP